MMSSTVASARIVPAVVESGHSRFPVMDEDRDDIIGFNVVGLKRRGFSRAAIAELKRRIAALHRAVYQRSDIAAAIATAGEDVSAASAMPSAA